MLPKPTTSVQSRTAALLLAVLLAGCMREHPADRVPAADALVACPEHPTTQPSATQKPAHPGLYVVYCNGMVDQLDLAVPAKTCSFQLSGHSGNPPAIAPLPGAGTRPDSCLARPALADERSGAAAGVVHIVASPRWQRDDTDGSMPYSVLTFALPGWTLQARQDLGRFDVLNGAPPRLERANGQWQALASGSNADENVRADMAAWGHDTAPASVHALAWSADTILVRYGLQGHGGKVSTAYALVHRAQRQVVLIAGVPGNDPEPALTLAPGGQFVLHSVRALRAVADGRQLAATGELRLYGADGKPVSQWKVDDVAGDWHPVALTPQGMAVFTNRQGGYRFVPLGRRFGTEPVADPGTDDLDGARPGVIYHAGG